MSSFIEIEDQIFNSRYIKKIIVSTEIDSNSMAIVLYVYDIYEGISKFYCSSREVAEEKLRKIKNDLGIL